MSVTSNDIKARLRINHNLMDSQLADDIKAAKAELIRLGISSSKVNPSNNEEYPLIDKAVIAYCLWIESSNEKMAAGYEAQWNLWKDELRKTPSYMETGNV